MTTMPVVGQNRIAKPLHIWEAYRDAVGGNFHVKAFPKPKPAESFADYFGRIGWADEALFKALIGVGMTEDGSSTNQRDYLIALEDLAGSLYKLRAELFHKWPK